MLAPAFPAPDRAPPTVGAPRSSADALQGALRLVLVLTGVLVIALGNRADPDLWGHVLYGRDVLASGALPKTATHTFTAPDQPWINHENLSELTFAAVDRLAGGPGLMALKCALGLLVLALLAGTLRRQRASPLVAAVVLPVVASVLAVGWSIRPQLFTYAFFTVLMVVADGCFPHRFPDESPPVETPGDRRRLWIAPPLFAVWANTHGGFVAGLAIFALYLGCRSLEAAWRDGRAALPRIAQYAAVLAASGAATLVNPYGVRYLTWLYTDLAPARPEIMEWLPLSRSEPAVFVRIVLLLDLVAAGWLGSRRPWDFTRTVVLAAAVWQSVMHARHAPFVAILAGLWLPYHLEGLRLRLWRPAVTAPARARAPIVLRAAAGLLAAFLAGEIGLLCARGVLVDRSWYPVKAFRYMAHHRLVGRTVVHFDWAQYALAAFAPATTVAFDGRFRTAFPQEIADMHFDFIQGAEVPGRWRSERSGAIDGTRVLEYGHPDLVLLHRNFPPAVRVLESQPGWVLLYQDGLAQLWGRRETYGDPGSDRYVAPAERRVRDRTPSGFAAWPALPWPGGA